MPARQPELGPAFRVACGGDAADPPAPHFNPRLRRGIRGGAAGSAGGGACGCGGLRGQCPRPATVEEEPAWAQPAGSAEGAGAEHTAAGAELAGSAVAAGDTVAMGLASPGWACQAFLFY